ncbi:hypothetical protein AB0H57_32120, partial [Micromonospora sp. NPDC050686]
ADGALGAGAVVVVSGAQVVEGGLFVGEQVPDDGQDGSADRDDGFFLAAASGEPAVSLAEKRRLDGARGAQMLLLGLAGLLIAVASALLPAGWAARTRTAAALRTE